MMGALQEQKPNTTVSYNPIICLVLSGISYILDVLDVPRLPWNFGTAMMAVLFIEIGFQINKMDILNKLKYQGFRFLFV